MEKELYITRDIGTQSYMGLWLYENSPKIEDDEFFDPLNGNYFPYNIDPNLFPEIKLGECKKVKITVEFINE